MTDISLPKIAADHNRISYGLTLMVISVLLSPLIDIFAKLAITTVPSAEITAVRFLLQVVFILPIVLVRGSLFDLTWRKTGLHALRGGLLVVTMLSFITTLKVMEVADAIAIFFVEPIILTILGSVFLKETIGWRRYTACGVGFFGALLVIQPSMQEVGPIALLPVVAAFALAVFLLVTRMVAQNEDPWSMQFHAGIWAASSASCSSISAKAPAPASSIRSGRKATPGPTCSASASPPPSRACSASTPIVPPRFGAGAAAISGDRLGHDFWLARLR